MPEFSSGTTFFSVNIAGAISSAISSHCSAEFHSAVSRIFNPQRPEEFNVRPCFQHSADWKSAIQQTECLRYIDRQLKSHPNMAYGLNQTRGFRIVAIIIFMRSIFQRFLVWNILQIFFLAVTFSALGQPVAPQLQIFRPTDSSGWMRLSSSFQSNSVLVLEASTNFLDWSAVGTLHDAVRNYPDVKTGDLPNRYYRLLAATRGLTNDWKNELVFPTEAFRSPVGGQNPRWVKFAIVLNDPARVYYQDSTRFPFHYDFATQRLGPFIDMTPENFDAVSLFRTNQQVVLGTVLFPPKTNFQEYAVQIVGLDSYTPAEISSWFNLVKATIFSTNAVTALYMPVFEQSELTRTNAGEFTALGIPVSSVERWIAANQCYSTGWALGRMKYFPANQIAAAFSSGQLQPGDILMTDGVPAETPPVAGIISLTPSTPNSHTAILSQSFGIPFVYISDAAERARVQSLTNHNVMLLATVVQDKSVIRIIDLETGMSPEFQAQLLALKKDAPIQYLPKELWGSFSASTDVLWPGAIKYFGGKAANYSLLRHGIPSNCPPAIAFSFDLWDAFLDQALTNGRTLRVEIALRLAPFTNYPPDIPALKTALKGMRDLFTKSAVFTGAQKQTITNALSVFNSNRKIRFRSSTNVEDSESFTGAGLYDSYSGCLLDDLDADETGPSICDSSEPEERGVFRAIQKVYASFYNDNAYLERLRHSVNESQVAMGVLVHHSFPDEEELANGVAVIHFNGLSATGDMVTQLGADSVTNPDGNSLPEVVSTSRSELALNFVFKQNSTLVPLGEKVMTWQDDYRGFMNLFEAVANSYSQANSGANNFYLDFEYKKDVNLGLVVKQVRALPPPLPATNFVPVYLINEPTTFVVAQKELGDAFANHRLKSFLTLQTTNLWLVSSNLGGNIFTFGEFNYLSNDTVQTLSGPLNYWPNASNSFASPNASNSWTTIGANDNRAWRLRTGLKLTLPTTQPPFVTIRDLSLQLTVNYPTPMPKVFANNAPTTTTSETVTLEMMPEISPGALLQQRSFTTNAVNIESTFYWPDPGSGFFAGYTAPLVRFVQTTITGLTTTPIVLTNYFSQTYHPMHHNFSEEFIFEPRLEPGLSSSVLAELNAANIQLIYVFQNLHATNATMRVLGFDKVFRKL